MRSREEISPYPGEGPVGESDLDHAIGCAGDTGEAMQLTEPDTSLGDWREEAVFTNASYDELIVLTTNKPTDTRPYTLAHNPAYRNDMTAKGYTQPHEVDYCLGNGMSTPSRPATEYAPRATAE
ncbi:hypothetical protein ACFYQ5_15535 [Streptomyces sp. NPDC005794]|uniref:rhamnogalacturonan lyase family protein n=1 Tax=Streptomyces sp. NPDC005794 TaxID=3364733 RepID=UPI0036BFB004